MPEFVIIHETIWNEISHKIFLFLYKVHLHLSSFVLAYEVIKIHHVHVALGPFYEEKKFKLQGTTQTIPISRCTTRW